MKLQGCLVAGLALSALGMEVSVASSLSFDEQAAN